MEWDSIPDLVRCGGRAVRRREAVVEGRTRVSYARTRRPRGARGGGLHGQRRASRATGSRIWAPNSLDWIVSALGAVSAGAVLVPLNTRFKGAEAADVLRRSGARLLFVTGTFLGTSYVASLRRAAREGPGTGPLPG